MLTLERRQVTYYNDQVVDEIKSWPPKLKSKYFRTLDLIEDQGPQLGEPFTKALGHGLFEIRVKAQEGIGRAFFCYQVKAEIIILHAFIKKTQKTPKKELELAVKRLREIL